MTKVVEEWQMLPKEIVTPCGADIFLSEVSLGDSSMNDFEIWNSEYQEQCSILVEKIHESACKIIAEREKCAY